MTVPGRTLVTFAVDAAMHRDLTIAATATNRSVAEEIEMRLMALRLIEEAMRILKPRGNVEGKHGDAIV